MKESLVLNFRFPLFKKVGKINCLSSDKITFLLENVKLQQKKSMEI